MWGERVIALAGESSHRNVTSYCCQYSMCHLKEKRNPWFLCYLIVILIFIVLRTADRLRNCKGFFVRVFSLVLFVFYWVVSFWYWFMGVCFTCSEYICMLFQADPLSYPPHIFFPICVLLFHSLKWWL